MDFLIHKIQMENPGIHIGTSGWHYKHWIGNFYPNSTKSNEQLPYYLTHFNTVELNNSFYRLPTPEVFTSWKKSVPDDFIFSVKASRFITHMKKLKDPILSTQSFFENVSYLGEKLGPILFQLPPFWKINLDRLEDFISHLPKEYQYTFEFRNPSWYTDEVYSVLKKYNCAFCIYELDHNVSPLEITSNFIYIRLHGPGAKYQGSYTEEILKKWATYCKKWNNEGKEIYIYFDNDQHGFAAFNAKRLQELMAN